MLNVNHFYIWKPKKRFSVVERDILVADIFAFHAVLTSYDTIGVRTSIQFNEVILNDGNGYVAANDGRQST